MEVIRKLKNNKVFKQIIIVIGMFASFYILDIALRIFSNKYINFYKWYAVAPNLFSFSWIILTIGILYLLPKKAKLIVYSILILISNIIVYSEYLYFKTLDRFFAFSDLLMTKEGSDYFWYSLSKTNYRIILLLITSFLISGITIWLIKKTPEVKTKKSYYLKIVISIIILFIGLRGIAYYKLGPKGDPLTWEAALNSKNVYIDFNNQNKSLEVSGIYELLLRSTYLYIKDNIFTNKEKIRLEVTNELINSTQLELTSNDYTGIFKGKNVIYILLESIDSWLITESVMPTTYNLKQTGFNFTNRYAPSFGGGQTINSEFAMNTGLYAIENGKAIYNYDKNTFSYSIANLLKNNGYSAASIHTNTGGFYNRTFFHNALGYEAHYALEDIKTINHTDYNYFLDSNLIKNKETYDYIVREEPFLTFITSYSAHLPYDESNELCNNSYGLEIDDNYELSCIRNLARETDEMIRLLIENLERDGLLDNTVLVLAADHYAYGYDDVLAIEQYKNTNNLYLLQNVPLIIWSNDLKHEEITTIMDTADILPTLLNMLDITYNPNYYVGTDVFSPYHDNFVYFSDYTFYDGNLFYDGTITDNKNIDYINEIITKINTKIELNEKVIISDYFKEKN